MVHVIFDINSVSLNDFIQSGGGPMTHFEGIAPYQRGRGGGYYVGFSRQRGAGVGSVLKSLWRSLLPLMKSIGSSVKQEGLATGGRILANLSEGAGLKDTLLNESQTGVTNLIEKARNKQTGGSGGFIKRKKMLKDVIIKPNSPKRVTFKKRSSQKRKRIDTFGLY